MINDNTEQLDLDPVEPASDTAGDDSQGTDRRQFVQSLAKKAAYAAPVIVTLAATRKALAASASGGS